MNINPQKQSVSYSMSDLEEAQEALDSLENAIREDEADIESWRANALLALTNLRNVLHIK